MWDYDVLYRGEPIGSVWKSYADGWMNNAKITKKNPLYHKTRQLAADALLK